MVDMFRTMQEQIITGVNGSNEPSWPPERYHCAIPAVKVQDFVDYSQTCTMSKLIAQHKFSPFRKNLCNESEDLLEVDVIGAPQLYTDSRTSFLIKSVRKASDEGTFETS